MWYLRKCGRRRINWFWGNAPFLWLYYYVLIFKTPLLWPFISKYRMDYRPEIKKYKLLLLLIYSSHHNLYINNILPVLWNKGYEIWAKKVYAIGLVHLKVAEQAFIINKESLASVVNTHHKSCMYFWPLFKEKTQLRTYFFSITFGLWRCLLFKV